MFDSNSYALNYINCFLIFLVFILQYHPDKNIIKNRQKEATKIFQVYNHHIVELMKIQISQTQQSNQSQNSQNSCPPTQESSESTHFGAGYNEDYDSFFKDFEEDFEEETEGYYDPDYLRKNAEERRKRDQEFFEKERRKYSWKDESVRSCQGKQFSQVLSTQGTSEAEWYDDGDVKGISKQRGEENITNDLEVVSIVETSNLTQETEAEDMEDEVEIIGTTQLNNGGRTFHCNMDDDDFVNSSDESNTEEVKDKEQKKSMTEYEEEVLKVASNPAPDKSKAEKDASIHQKTTEIENHSKETKEASYDSEVDDDASSDINALSSDWKITLEASDCGNLSNSP